MRCYTALSELWEIFQVIQTLVATTCSFIFLQAFQSNDCRLYITQRVNNPFSVARALSASECRTILPLGPLSGPAR